MIKLADIPISDVLETLGNNGIRASVLVPTETGLAKSILDATRPLRELFRESDFHDYDTQSQGPTAKAVKSAVLHIPGGSVEARVSLYRPETKAGDPRLWISGLPEFASAGNVLALAIYDDVLHVINMSRHRHLIFHSPTDAMRRLMSSQQQSIGFQHLLSSLRSIAAEGWFRSLRHGDTGVGYTIETKLGISANSSKAPDYMGVEIKSTRSRPGKDKVTLFSRTPHWRLSSALGGLNAREFIKRVGVLEGKFRRYYATVYPRPNPQGVYSRIVRSNDQVRFETRIGEPDELAHCWQLLELEDALRVKHKQTAFLEVETRSGSAGEEFRLSSVTYRSGPIIENLEYLLESGDITLDYTLRELSDTRVRDHGYLFRMSGGRLRKLFAKELEFPLGD